MNKYHSVRTPYFVDDYGTNCAVGQMIWDSGNEDLVRKISAEYNYDYIKDIKTEGLVEWTEKHGFLVDELKWIQPGYYSEENVEQVLNGTNGKVNKLNAVPHSTLGNIVLIGGEFTELDSLPCLNVGYYKDNQLTCFGDGIPGKVFYIFYSTKMGIFAVGELLHDGNTYPLARFVDDEWEFFEIPGREGAIGTIANPCSDPHCEIELAISHSSIPLQQEYWKYRINQG